jgi:hypothetical protein
MADSPQLKHKQMLKQFYTINKDLEKKLLFLFNARCKLKHSMCFFQFRSLLPDPNEYDLRDIFENRKSFLIRVLRRCSLLMRKRAAKEN